MIFTLFSAFKIKWKLFIVRIVIIYLILMFFFEDSSYQHLTLDLFS